MHCLKLGLSFALTLLHLTKIHASKLAYSSFAGGQCLSWLMVAPSQVLIIDPAWYTCTRAMGGCHDPPYALTKVPAPDSPQQGPILTSSSPQPTSTPSGIPTITSVCDIAAINQGGCKFRFYRQRVTLIYIRLAANLNFQSLQRLRDCQRI